MRDRIVEAKWRQGAFFALLSVSGAVLVACGGGGDSSAPLAPIAAPTTPSAAPTLAILSSRAELVTGGNVLVAIKGTGTAALVARVNGVDVSAQFSADPKDATRTLGLIGGLTLGANLLEASMGGATATLALTNYPITGPVLSGPQLSPYACQTGSFKLPDGTTLGAPTDTNCSAPTQVQYMYRKTSGGALVAMPNTTTLPADVASTANLNGVVVPFVVRIETGTMNRGVYQNAILHDPTKDAAPTPATPPRGWNRKLIAVHGTGCATGWYIQGAAMGVSPYTANNLTRLGEGYAVFTNTLNHPTNSCNATLAGETTMMGKEHFIKTFGVPDATVSVGTSGGAYTSLQIADAFPGMFDGVFIDATFPDALAIAMSAMDDKLLNRYLTTTGTAGVTEAQMVQVSGHKSARAWYDLALQSGRTDPLTGRVETIPTAGSLIAGGYASGAFNAAVPAALRWDALTNPGGARATVFDVGRNIYGVDAVGYGRRPFDNIGVQYGLAQLNSGAITTTQFLELNEKIGGYDTNGNYIASRTAGDSGAIKRAYQSGLQLGGGGGLASIPIFDLSNFYDEDNYYHYQWFHFAARERLRQANGDSQNHVMWRGGVSFSDLFGLTTPGKAERAAVNAKAQADAWVAFVKWVSAYKADTTALAQRDKVIAGKPAEAVDGCFSFSTSPTFIAEPQTLGSTGAAGSCNAIWPSWSFPRAQAGGPLAADKLKCALKPVNLADYAISFTGPEQARLTAAFPAGVCDFGQAGAYQVPVVPYASFGPSPVNLVFDVTKP